MQVGAGRLRQAGSVGGRSEARLRPTPLPACEGDPRRLASALPAWLEIEARRRRAGRVPRLPPGAGIPPTRRPTIHPGRREHLASRASQLLESAGRRRSPGATLRRLSPLKRSADLLDDDRAGRVLADLARLKEPAISPRLRRSSRGRQLAPGGGMSVLSPASRPAAVPRASSLAEEGTEEAAQVVERSFPSSTAR